MTTTNTNPRSFRDIVLAGDAADGSGALTGWNGLGPLGRNVILEALAEADISISLAPTSKSDVGHVGNALSRLNNLGFVARRARRSDWRQDYTGKTRSYRARWIVFPINASDAKVGDSVGNCTASFELHDDSHVLHVTGAENITAPIVADYEARRADEVYQAGDVTSWIRGLLIRHAGATRYAMGYYIPAGGRAFASRLIAAMAKRWGTNWASPLLPVSTSDELNAGIARAFADEIGVVARASAEAAPATPAKAAQLLKDLLDIDSRADAYRVLVGEAALAPAITELRRLRDFLAPIAGTASQRFALLELDGAPRVAATDVKVPGNIVRRVAERTSSLKARYIAARIESGLSADDFKAQCLLFLDPKSPQDWVTAAEAVGSRGTAAKLADDALAANPIKATVDPAVFNTDNSIATTVKPECPVPGCGADMTERTARRGRNSGQKFWGCSQYRNGCRGTRPFEAAPVAPTPEPEAAAPRASSPVTGERFSLLEMD